MTEPAVQVEHIGKRYRIGVARERHDTLRDAIADALRSPLRNLRRLRRLSRFSDPSGRADNPDDVIWALRDVSFEVRHGEALGIIGRNGAGKSTLLKVLSRITKPTAGRAVVRGRVGSLLEVGTGFHQELTGRENVYLNGSILGMDRAYIDRMFEEIVEFSGVEKFIDTPVKRYSSGMKVRLAFAVAAHLEPEVLIIDEVLAVGDAEFQAKCLGKMDSAAHEGRTVLFVSHDMDAVTRLCGRAILLDQGRVVADGPADEVVYRYLNGVGDVSSSATWTGAESRGTGVELRSVRVLKSDGSVAATATVKDTLRLELVYSVDRPRIRFRCGAVFFSRGTCAFTTIEPTETERSRPGLYRSVVTIPPDLLAEGHYAVNVAIASMRGARVRHVDKRWVVAFQVTDPMDGTTARGDYPANLNGVVRPRLRWNVEPGRPDGVWNAPEPEDERGRIGQVEVRE